jgi:hypothetical protein
VPSRSWTRPPDLLYGEYSGHVTGDDVSAMHAAMTKLHVPGSTRFVLVDTSALTSFAPAVTTEGGPFLKGMKALGIEKLIVIAPSASVRMVGSAISLAASLSFRFVESTHDAEALLAELRAKARGAVASRT